MIDTHEMDVKTTSMTTKIKRTYNLSPEAVARVRDLVGRADLPASQDGVVELAIDHLHREIGDRDDAARWALAAGDGEFREQDRTVAADLAPAEAWPAE